MDIRLLALSSLLIILISSPVQAGKIVKWTDENGKVHFGDRPPVGSDVKVETIIVKPTPISNNPPPPESVQKKRDQQIEELRDEIISNPQTWGGVFHNNKIRSKIRDARDHHNDEITSLKDKRYRLNKEINEIKR